MGKQINSANKMENNSKKNHETGSMKETRKIDDYFNFGNKKRNREEIENSKEDGVLRSTNKINNQTNNIAPISKDKVTDFKSKNFYFNIFKNYFN